MINEKHSILYNRVGSKSGTRPVSPGRQLELQSPLWERNGPAAGEAGAELPSVRVLAIKTIPAGEPLQNLAEETVSGWTVLNKDAALKMNAAAFHVARGLAKDAGVPIGIIDLNMGYHFPIAWLSKDALLETKAVFGQDATQVDTITKEALAQDKKRYDAYIKSLALQLPPEKDEADGAAWKELVGCEDPKRGGEGPQATLWRMKTLESIELAPEGWTGDDAAHLLASESHGTVEGVV